MQIGKSFLIVNNTLETFTQKFLLIRKSYMVLHQIVNSGCGKTVSLCTEFQSINFILLGLN